MNVNSNLKSTGTYWSTIHTKYTEVWRIWIIKQPLLNSRQRDNWAVRSCSVQDWRAYILGPMQHRNQVWGYLINNPEHTMGIYHLAIWVSGMQYSTLYVQWSNISQWHESPFRYLVVYQVLAAQVASCESTILTSIHKHCACLTLTCKAKERLQCCLLRTNIKLLTLQDTNKMSWLWYIALSTWNER